MSESSVTSSFSFFQALSKSSSSVDVPSRVNVENTCGLNIRNKINRATSLNSSNNNQNDPRLCSQSDSSKCYKNKPRPRDFPTDFLPSRKLPLSKSTSTSSIPPSFTNRPMSPFRSNSNRLPNKLLLLNNLPKSSNSRASSIIDSPKYFRFPSSPFDVSFNRALPQGRFNQYFYSVPSTPGYQTDNQPSIELVPSTPSLDDPNVHWFRTSKNFSLHYHSPSKAVHISQVDSPNHHNPLRIFNTDASLSECYFAGKGAAVVLAPHDRPPPASIHPQPRPPDIQHHLQSMFYLLRQEETLKMAVKLESVHPGRTRYLVVVSRQGKQMTEESCLLGIDCNHSTTVGLVLKVLADTSITLDGDGGFSVTVAAKTHIFKPVSVQAMWSALQTLHKVSGKARAHNYFLGGVSHEWVGHYEQNVASDRSCLNEWHTMDSIESRRPPSPDSIRHKPVEREETKALIRSSLKEIMMSVDLDDVTSKQVRTKLEESLDVDLAEYKPFIDQEMLVILGQMDEATEIFPHVYLGSEWNASNLEELTKNGVCHILNVTREIDNFFPGMFDYLNIRVYDDEKTDLLKHWDDTFKYITKAKKAGSKVLVHCKMGVSRSASVVIAYAMKAYSWDLKQAIAYVQNKRSCIKPNASFIQQLETYQGMLDAMKNREKLQRSKSETNLKCNGEAMRTAEVCGDSGSEASGGPSEVLRSKSESEARVPPLHAPPPAPPLPVTLTPHRPKSWSPDHATANNIFTTTNGSAIGVDEGVVPPPPPLPPPPTPPIRSRGVSVWMPCSNGLAYCVSQNKILHLPTVTSGEDGVVKSRVEKLETGKKSDRKGMVLNLKDQFEEDRLQLNSRSCLLKDSLSQKEDHLKEGFSQRDSFSKEVLRQWESQQKDAPIQRDTFILRDPPSHCNVLTVQDGIIQRIQDASVQQMDQDRPVERRDPFSSQLDRVFDKEETSGISISRQNSLGSGDRISPEPGIVKSLKREFEAKSKSSGGSSGGSSLPSSPVSERSGQSAAPTASLEDLTSRGIVNRHKPPKAPPPPAAVAVATTVLAKAQKKKLQQGKTHPLARLTYKTRHPNPVYNTM